MQDMRCTRMRVRYNVVINMHGVLMSFPEVCYYRYYRVHDIHECPFSIVAWHRKKCRPPLKTGFPATATRGFVLTKKH